MDVRDAQRQPTNNAKEFFSSLWQRIKPKATLGEALSGLTQQGDHFPRMVNWYDPSQLAQTAVEVFVSKTLGRHADRRSIEASNREARFFDFSVAQVGKNFMEETRQIRRVEFDLCQVTGTAEPNEIWIDYVSDLGDGFNPTYAVASLLTQDALQVPGVAEPLKRGHILIFGGDEVYPTATRKEYEERLVHPYEWAWREVPGNAPYLFALPGNHDWYDSLSSFMEYFGDCDRETFARGWHVPQNRSYFALKLPQGWWLLGVDFQLQSDLDHWQIRYFEKIVNLHMQPGDRIILCAAEPFWVFEKLDPELRKKRLDSNLHHLLDILKTKRGQTRQAGEAGTTEDKQIAVYLAGDLHHYFRVWGKGNNEDPEEKNKLQITSGGGGAFLHPTHGAMARAYAKSDYRTKSYPSAWASWWLGWYNFGFLWWNRRFGSITAVMYLLVGWFAFFSDLQAPHYFRQAMGSADLRIYLEACISATFHSPLLTILVLLCITGFYGFTLTESLSRWYRLGGGILHGVVQVTAAFFFLWVSHLLALMVTTREIKDKLFGWGQQTPGLATLLNYQWFLNAFATLAELVLTAGLLFFFGWIIGSCLMGVYLFISLNIFGQHQTNAFSSLKIQDWKNFLRLKLNLETGELTIYPIGIRRVPRAWEPAGADEHIPLDPLQEARNPQRTKHYKPADESEIEVELIEGPIVITPIENHVDRVNVSFKGQTSRVKRSNQWLQRYHLQRRPFAKRKSPNDP